VSPTGEDRQSGDVPLCQRHIYGQRRCTAEPHVARDADDLHLRWGRLGTIPCDQRGLNRHVSPYRVGVRSEEALSCRLAKDHHRFAALAIPVSKVTAPQHRDPRGAEVLGRDQRPIEEATALKWWPAWNLDAAEGSATRFRRMIGERRRFDTGQCSDRFEQASRKCRTRGARIACL
jgi:hypothetical protein